MTLFLKMRLRKVSTKKHTFQILIQINQLSHFPKKIH
jgi:hypothetical protein